MGEANETKRSDEKEEPAAAAASPSKELFDRKKSTNNESSEKSLVPFPEKDAADLEVGESTGKPKDRDVALAQVEMEKRMALIKAWEENEKTIVDNKAYKKLSAIDSWENIKRASIEAQIKEIEEKIERKKAEYREKMKNKMAIVHKAAEEKRALIEADRGKDFLMVEETAAKFRASGIIPKKVFACFTC